MKTSKIVLYSAITVIIGGNIYVFTGNATEDQKLMVTVLDLVSAGVIIFAC